MKKLKFGIVIILLITFSMVLIGQNTYADIAWTDKAIRDIADEQAKIAIDKIYLEMNNNIKSVKEDIENVIFVRLPQIYSRLDKIEKDLAILKQQNESLDLRIKKLENQNIIVPIIPIISIIKTRYYKYENKPEIYETGTNRHIGFTEAMLKNIWNDIQIIK